MWAFWNEVVAVVVDLRLLAVERCVKPHLMIFGNMTIWCWQTSQRKIDARVKDFKTSLWMWSSFDWKKNTFHSPWLLMAFWDAPRLHFLSALVAYGFILGPCCGWPRGQWHKWVRYRSVSADEVDKCVTAVLFTSYDIFLLRDDVVEVCVCVGGAAATVTVREAVKETVVLQCGFCQCHSISDGPHAHIIYSLLNVTVQWSGEQF